MTLHESSLTDVLVLSSPSPSTTIYKDVLTSVYQFDIDGTNLSIYVYHNRVEGSS